MNILFMGTPDFSVPTLEHCLKAGHTILAVVTQPDKPKGRGREMACPAVKEAALQHGLTVLQPKKVRYPEVIETLKEFQPDVIVVVAFGQILPKEVLEIPKICCVNVHASLLPKFRGAAPIQWAIIEGEKETGVTTMRMDEGLDTGDMILKTVVPIEQEETGGSLFEKLSVEGAKLCVKTLQALENQTAVFEKQDETKASHVKMLKKEFGHIDWSKSAVEMEHLIRGLNPWPSAFTKWQGKTLKIWKAYVIEENKNVDYGIVTAVEKDCLCIQTGNGQLAITELQLEGKKRMPVESFLRGYTILEGSAFDA